MNNTHKTLMLEESYKLQMREGEKQVKIIIGQLLAIITINDVDNKPMNCGDYYFLSTFCEISSS